MDQPIDGLVTRVRLYSVKVWGAPEVCFWPVEGSDRRQVTLLPECLEDYITEDNPVRVVEAFVEELDLEALGFARAMPATTGRPAYHPALLLKIFILWLPQSSSVEPSLGA
jgi:hypothetical protein